MRLKTRQLELVVALNRERGVTRAARRLRLTQPAVSQALAQLEKQYGQRLFERERGGVTPTAAGDRFVEVAEQVLRRLDDLERDLEGFARGRRSVLRITTECYTAYWWLPEVLEKLWTRHPEADLRIVPEAVDDPVLWLRRRELDVALTHSIGVAPDLTSQRLFRDELVALVAPGHRLASRKMLEPEEFADQELLLHSHPRQSAVFREFLDPAGVTPASTTTLQLTEAVLSAVKARLGLTVMTRWAVRREVERGELHALRLGTKGLFRIWRATCLAATEESAPRDDLIALLKELRPEAV